MLMGIIEVATADFVSAHSLLCVMGLFLSCPAVVIPGPHEFHPTFQRPPPGSGMRTEVLKETP